jgi:hypothetical protein
MTFFIVYWVTEMIYGVLALLAILEVFKPTLGAYFEPMWGRWMPALTLMGVVGISMWRGLYHPVGQGNALGAWAAGAYTFMLEVLFLQIIVFAVCLRLALRRPYPVRWGRYRLGIIGGFGLAACASATAYLLRFVFGARYEVVFHYVLPGAYIGAAAGWLMAFWRPESPRSRRPIEDYRRAVEAMSEAVEQAKKDSGLLNCRAT